MKEPSQGFPERVWVVPLDEVNNAATHGIYFAAATIWNSGWRKPKPKEYLSLQEHQEILTASQARVKALEEALAVYMRALEYIIEHEKYHGVNQGRDSYVIAEEAIAKAETILS